MASTETQASHAPSRYAVIALFAPLLVTIYDQTHWWREKEDYGFGWLAPVFAAYVLHERWARLQASLTPSSSSPSRWHSVAVGLSGFLAAAFFLIGSAYRAAAGPTFGGTLAITLGGSGLVLTGFAWIALRANAESVRRVLGLVLFPTLIWVVSAPMLTVIENTLSVTLRAWITEVVFGFYNLLGFSLEQQGNILLLPSGQVGVEEACSGIRSLTGCLFAGSFLAAVFTQKRSTKLFLVSASLFFAFISNLLRSLFLTGYAMRYGAHSIEGTVHDASGYAVLGLTVVLLVLTLPLIERRSASEAA